MASTDKICFDRVLPRDTNRPHPGRRMTIGSGPARAAFQVAKLWPNGSIIRIRFIGGTAAQHALVEQHATEWTDYSNLQFDFGNHTNAQVRISFEDDGAWSYIGTDALGIPANQATMNFGWLDQGVVLHEFGHMLGMIHEHQNPIDNPIQWDKPAVTAALSGPPNFWTPAQIEHNMFAKYEVSQINGSQLDLASVMLYSFPASWTTNGFHTDPNDALSSVDRAFAAHVYPPAAQVVELPVQSGVLQADIGEPGEEDLYRFTAADSATYTIETKGQTDLVMTLYADDDTIIAQDDDTGTGRNPRIVAPLVPGGYKVQVRHYNSLGGTGQYGILVTK